MRRASRATSTAGGGSEAAPAAGRIDTTESTAGEMTVEVQFSLSQPESRDLGTHLACDDLVERDEHTRGDRPTESELALRPVHPSESDAQPHLRHERDQRRSHDRREDRGRGGRGWVGRGEEVDGVEVGRKVVSVVEPSEMVEIGVVKGGVAPSERSERKRRQ